jgi:hypothetical protein
MRNPAALCLLALAIPSASLAESETAKWGQVGGWVIRVDRSVGDGCFAVQVFERGTIVRIGLDITSKRVYLFIGHNEWKSLEVGKLYPVRVVFDGVKSYNGEMKGQTLGHTVFLVHRDLSADLIKDFMERNGMEVFYRGERIANLSLRNTYAAIAEVINCQKELAAAGPAPREDPFASAPTAPRDQDPFR